MKLPGIMPGSSGDRQPSSPALESCGQELASHASSQSMHGKKAVMIVIYKSGSTTVLQEVLPTFLSGIM